MRFKSLLIALFCLVFFQAGAFVVTVQNQTTFSSLGGQVGDLMLVEDYAGELANTTVTIRLKNSSLWYTLSEDNIVTTSYARNSESFPVILGIIGTNIIKITFPQNTLSGGVAIVKITNIWVNTQYEEGDYDILADVSAVVYGDIVTYSDIVLGHKFSEEEAVSIPIDRKYLAYFSNEGNWWSAGVFINDTDSKQTFTIDFFFEEDSVSKTYSAEPHSKKVLPFYSDPTLRGGSGYLRVYLPPGTDFITLCGDGTQLFSQK